MAKKKQAKFIQRDNDGTYFCSKCGQSGFNSQQQGYGHLTQCKGYAKVIAEAKKESSELSKSIDALGMKYSNQGLNVGGLPATLGPASGPRPSALIEASQGQLEILLRQNNILKGRNLQLEKIAFNHNEHAISPMNIQNRSFSGPQDMVTASLGDLFKYPIVRIVLGATALVILINFCKKHFGELLGDNKKRR